MPKTKPKVPKTEKMWMGWTTSGNYLTGIRSKSREKCAGILKNNGWEPSEAKPVPVRIMPEAEYQRFKEMEKDYERLTSL